MIHLTKVDPARNMARFYVLDIQRRCSANGRWSTSGGGLPGKAKGDAHHSRNAGKLMRLSLTSLSVEADGITGLEVCEAVVYRRFLHSIVKQKLI